MPKQLTNQWYPAPRYLCRKNIITKYLKKHHSAGESILEIGYGSGDMLVAYHDLGLAVTGYDFSDVAYETAKQRIAEQELDVKILRSESEIKQRFDYVVACEVLEHVENDIDQLMKWKQFIKPNGTFILSVPARMKKWNANDTWAGHLRRYEKSELHTKLKSVGLSNVKILSYPFPANIILDYLLDKAGKRLLSQEQYQFTSKEEATKISGVVGPTKRTYHLISNSIVMAPCFWMQRLFFKTDLCSSYVVFARRID